MIDCLKSARFPSLIAAILFGIGLAATSSPAAERMVLGEYFTNFF